MDFCFKLKEYGHSYVDAASSGISNTARATRLQYFPVKIDICFGKGMERNFEIGLGKVYFEKSSQSLTQCYL